jgi:flagellar biosynthesis protein FlhB
MRDALVQAVRVAAGLSARGADLATATARALALGLLPCLGAAILALGATAAQTRGGLWPHLALPDLSRLWNPGRLLRSFTREGFGELLLALAKLAVLGGATWTTLRDASLTLPALLDAAPPAQLAVVLGWLGRLAVNVLTALAILAGADLAFAFWRYARKMRMGRDEAKRDLKEDEGDPLIRAQRRARQRELARNRVALEVPRADAVIVNPEHVAVAIRYRPDESAAPRVTAKGQDHLALVMRAIARAHGVPVVENPPLARLLARQVKVGGEVPIETYQAVAAVLAFVYRVTGRSARRAS